MGGRRLWISVYELMIEMYRSCGFLVHVVQLAVCFVLADEDSDYAASHHAFPVDPRVDFHEQLSSVSAGGFHQFWLATGMERQVRCDVVHLAVVA
jgi:hypothetical protein